MCITQIRLWTLRIEPRSAGREIEGRPFTSSLLLSFTDQECVAGTEKTERPEARVNTYRSKNTTSSDSVGMDITFAGSNIMRFFFLRF